MNVNPRNAWEVAPVNETEIEPMASAWRPLWPGHNDALELRQLIWMSAGNPHKFNFVDEVEGTLRYRHCLNKLQDRLIRRVRPGVITVDHELVWRDDGSVVAVKWRYAFSGAHICTKFDTFRLVCFFYLVAACI